MNAIMHWWLGAMGGMYIVVRIHESWSMFKGYLKKERMRMNNMKETDPAKKVTIAGPGDPGDQDKAESLLTAVEKVRLGGIVKSLTVEVKSLNRGKWNTAVFMSMGMFYWIMGKPNQ